MQKISLNGTWNGICYLENGQKDFSFNGTVPGCVHTDLISENIIDYDIFYRDNAEKYLIASERQPVLTNVEQTSLFDTVTKGDVYKCVSGQM